ncbi:MAG TPA: HDIG domain-containing protein [Candidatus Hydrogenedens sp.]|nr:HDIG domain-containing protein [Candidatus Hydrogenedens sp.]HOK09029.1 HDIG domain-containing protein [Candidatus Hydrogenedens sp.]HOL19364.1 HDIG domain-containing protein [Candidatus Hydrogenedens sp.]HPP58016.1 HDIG domain-containing protein [Candidatus Hydrogenedens sp.]
MSEKSGTQRKIGFPSLDKISQWQLRRDKHFLSPQILIVGILSAIFSAFLITSNFPQETLTPEEVDREIVAKQELRANFSFQTEDVKATQEARNQAREKVLPHYRIDKEKVQKQLQTLRERISQLQTIRTKIYEDWKKIEKKQEMDESSQFMSYAQQVFNEIYPTIKWAENIEASKLLLWILTDVNLENRNMNNNPFNIPNLGENLQFSLSDGKVQLPDIMAKVAEESLNSILNEGIFPVQDKGNTEIKIAIIRDVSETEQKVTQEILLRDVPDIKQAIENKLKPKIQEEARKIAKQFPSLDWLKVYEAIMSITSDLVVDTLQYDSVATEIVRERSAESINPVMKEIAAGEIIQERGKRWTLESRSDAKTYLNLLNQSQGESPRWLFSFIAHLIIVLLAYVSLYRAIRLWEHKGEPSSEAIWYLALLLINGILLLGKTMQFFDTTGFSVPVAITGILFAILVQMRLSAFLSFITCVLLSILFRYDWRLLIFDLAMTMGAVFTIYRVRKRRDITSASLSGIFIGFLTLLAITLTTDTLIGEMTVRRFLLLGINGSLCILLVPGILPFLERLFGIVTDFQLLEYSDLNNEILRKLAVRAPATYSHSLILGQLAERAADAIDANGLLARVCAYYHDIGKMRHSEYFYENQNGNNIHDTLSPRNSVRIIINHVNEGVKLAQEYHLPKPVTEAIAQHHGTYLVSYFYKLAIEQQKFGDVNEQDFRYPGPKPQKPEYAIIMICDAAESAVRSLKNPNPERIRQLVDRLVTERANDGQFDECDLTLRQLNIIIEEVSLALNSLHHLRPSYPGINIEEEHANTLLAKTNNHNAKPDEILLDNKEVLGK